MNKLNNAQSILLLIANYYEYFTNNTIYVVDKTIYLLKKKINIFYQNFRDDTMLHTFFNCFRTHENQMQIN